MYVNEIWENAVSRNNSQLFSTNLFDLHSNNYSCERKRNQIEGNTQQFHSIYSACHGTNTRTIGIKTKKKIKYKSSKIMGKWSNNVNYDCDCCQPKNSLIYSKITNSAINCSDNEIRAQEGEFMKWMSLTRAPNTERSNSRESERPRDNGTRVMLHDNNWCYQWNKCQMQIHPTQNVHSIQNKWIYTQLIWIETCHRKNETKTINVTLSLSLRSHITMIFFLFTSYKHLRTIVIAPLCLYIHT